jgi:hypothetical protein
MYYVLVIHAFPTHVHEIAFVDPSFDTPQYLHGSWVWAHERQTLGMNKPLFQPIGKLAPF